MSPSPHPRLRRRRRLRRRLLAAISNSSDVEAFMFILTFYLIARTAHILTPLFCHASGLPLLLLHLLLLPAVCGSFCVAFAVSGMLWYASAALRSLSLPLSPTLGDLFDPPASAASPPAAAAN